MGPLVIRRSLGLLPLSLLLAATLPGCQATCRNVCDKIVEECELGWDPLFDSEDCRIQCEQQEEHYEDDPDATEAFEGHLECLLDTTCDDLEADPEVCRDEEIYIF